MATTYQPSPSFSNPTANPPWEPSAAHVYRISNTTFRHHYNVITAAGAQLYRVENSPLRPNKPDLTVHAGSDNAGPIVAVCKFLHFSRHLKVGLGDPSHVNLISYEDLLAQDHRHAKYRWQMTMQSAQGYERPSFLWTRTHSVGVQDDSLTSMLSNRNFKLVEEQTGRVIAVFTSPVWSLNETGTLQMYVNYGREFDLMALTTVLGLYEKARRRRESSAATA